MVRFIMGLMFVLLVSGVGEAQLINAGHGEVALPAVDVSLFAEVPGEIGGDVAAALTEGELSLDAAINREEMLDFLGVKLSPEQKQFLGENKFLLVPVESTSLAEADDYFGYDEMLIAWDTMTGYLDPVMREPENAKLVSPDVMLHAFHKFFENSLEYLEQYSLAGTLREFVQRARSVALAHAASAKGELKEHFDIVAAQLTVPLVILENAQWKEVPEYGEEEPELEGVDSLDNALIVLSGYAADLGPELRQAVEQELASIYAADTVGKSPLFARYDPALKTDYTQFTPRSHYTKTSVLRAYFRSMMYLGRNSYVLNEPAGATDAMIVALIMAGSDGEGRPVLEPWTEIMDLTSFYAGQSDDIGYPEWRDFLVSVLGTDKMSPGAAVNPGVLSSIAANLDQLRPPKIFSDVLVDPEIGSKTKEEMLEESKSFRYFGQRFTFDAYMLSELTAGEEATPVPLPSTPSALFVPAVFGSRAARGYLSEYLQSTSQRFPGQAEVDLFLGELDKIAAEIGLVRDEEWFSSLGTAWLRLLDTLTERFGDGYPAYMRSVGYSVKQLETFLGSYTELKHDTILYAKQSFAEMGMGEEEVELPPVPKGFVEPNLEFWHQLQRLVLYASAGFRRYGLFERDLEEYGRLGRFQAQVDFYTLLAEKELRGEPLTEEEYESLRIEPLGYMAEPFIPGALLEKEQKRSGLVADIHTDAASGSILYEATGRPYVMLALVGNEGTTRLVAGVAFNHYEFTGPLGGQRYTDEYWRSIAYDDPANLPEKNFWYRGLIVR